MTDEENFDDEEDIILSELNDEELVEQMHDDLYNGLKEEIEEGTNILLEQAPNQSVKWLSVQLRVTFTTSAKTWLA